MKKIRSFVALCLVMAMAFSFSATAFAAAPDEAVTDTVVVGENETIVYQDDEMTIVETPVDANAFGVSPLATSYNSKWLDTSANGSFSVYTSNTGTIGITLKVESSSSDSWAYISVKKPNGSYFKNKVFLQAIVDPEAQYKIYFASSGSYTIEYTGWTEVGMRIMCWMY